MEYLSPQIIEILNKNNVHSLQAVQRETIKDFLNKEDMIVFAGTGSGKTLAYLIPLLERLDKDFEHPQAMVILPTQELARQVFREANKYGKLLGISAALLVGGTKIKTQIEELKKRPKLLIGTPGRMLDLIQRKKLRMHDVKTIVLDEGDFLVADFFEDIEKIVKTTQKERQVVLYSATQKKDTIEMAEKLMNAPKIYHIERVFPKQIKHLYIEDSLRNHFNMVRKVLAASRKSIIFVRSDYEAKELLNRISHHNYRVSVLSSDQENIERAEAIDTFTKEKKHVLVTTDLACRGLHVDDIDTVVHMQVPDSDTYVHRSGRTGRMGKPGKVVVLAEKKDKRNIEKIESELHIKFEAWDTEGGHHARKKKEKNNKIK